MEIELWHWGAFGVVIVALLVMDLVVFHRHAHVPSIRESAAFTVMWIGLAIVFNVFLWWWQGSESGALFLTGYLIEKSLSMDNVFVFAVIFRFFQIPIQYQYRVLFWGILGAIVMRLGFILGGIELIERFRFVIPLFGAFLIYTAYKLARHSPGDEVHPERNIFLRIGRKLFRVTRDDHRVHGDRFFARQDGLLCVTPMFLVLLVVESTDVLFAVDSVPAIIGITHDRFIAFTSNVFAILGLRALYLLLAGVIDLFRYLHYGLSAVLAFVGGKMVAEYVHARFYAHGEEAGHLVHPFVSLAVVASLLTISVVASIVAARGHKDEIAEATEPEPETGH